MSICSVFWGSCNPSPTWCHNFHRFIKYEFKIWRHCQRPTWLVQVGIWQCLQMLNSQIKNPFHILMFWHCRQFTLQYITLFINCPAYLWYHCCTLSTSTNNAGHSDQLVLTSLHAALIMSHAQHHTASAACHKLVKLSGRLTDSHRGISYSQRISKAIITHWECCAIELFATHWNRQIPLFVSPYQIPEQWQRMVFH